MIKTLIFQVLTLFGLSVFKRRLINIIINIKRKDDHITISLNANVRNSMLESNIAVLGDAEIIASDIGRGTYIGSGCRINNTKIGRFCSIAKNLDIVSGNHPTTVFVSTHPMFYLAQNSTIKNMGLDSLTESLYPECAYANEYGHYVDIGNDVWIGQNVSIINGVKIGDGAIIATGSVIIKDVPPFAIVGGVPAKVIKMRFNDEEQEYLTKTKWWEASIDELKKNAQYFDCVDNFKIISK